MKTIHLPFFVTFLRFKIGIWVRVWPFGMGLCLVMVEKFEFGLRLGLN